MVGVLHILETTHLAVGATAENIPARDEPWTARIVTTSPMYALVDHEDNNPAATADDFPVIEYQETFLAVPAGYEISLIGDGEDTDDDVWVSRVRVAAY
jgi:hypothetical protein